MWHACTRNVRALEQNKNKQTKQTNNKQKKKKKKKKKKMVNATIKASFTL